MIRIQLVNIFVHNTHSERRLVCESGVQGVSDREVDSDLVEIVLKNDEAILTMMSKMQP